MKIWVKCRKGFGDEGYHLAEPFEWYRNKELKTYKLYRDGVECSYALEEDLIILSKEDVVKLKLKGVI